MSVSSDDALLLLMRSRRYQELHAAVVRYRCGLAGLDHRARLG